MKKYVPLILCCSLIVFSYFVPENVWAQSGPGADSPAVTGITAGRAKSIAGGAIAIFSLVMGWRANKARRNPTVPAEKKRTPAIVALVLGGIALALSSIHLSTSASAVYGSGSGKAGAIVALVLALAGAGLGGLALRPKST